MTTRPRRARDAGAPRCAKIDPVIAEFLNFVAQELARQYLETVANAASTPTSSAEPTREQGKLKGTS